MDTRAKISAPDGVNLTIGWKAEKYTVYIPAKGTLNNKRMEIQLRLGKYKDEKLCKQFADFIEASLTNVVEQWETLRQMHEWVSSSRQSWKQTVTAQWETKLQLPTRAAKKLQKRVKQPDSVASARAATPPQVVYNAKNDSTIMIPVLPLQGKHQKCPTISVYPRSRKVGPNGRTRKAQVIVFIPGAMLPGSQKRREYSMGIELGAAPEWHNFVADFVSYAVSKWKNKDDAIKWESNFAVFRDHLIKLFKVYRSRGTSFIQVSHRALQGPQLPFTRIKIKYGLKRVWKLGPSTSPVPWDYIKNPNLPEWTEDLIDNKGFGVYCTVRGAYTFDWTFPEDKEHKEIFFKADKRKDKLTDRQKNYQVTGSMDAQLKDTVVWVPTTKAFEMGTVHMPAIIGHNSENPTHKIDVDPITLKTLVVPVTDKNGNPRITDVDEEFSIDYNLLGSKDDSHLGKQRKKTRKKRKRVAKRKPPASRKPPAKKRNKRNKRTNAKHKKDDVIDLTGDIDKATAKPTRVTAKRKNRNARTNVKRKKVVVGLSGDAHAGAATSATDNAEGKKSCRGKVVPKPKPKRTHDWLKEVQESTYVDEAFDDTVFKVHDNVKAPAGQCLFAAIEDQLNQLNLGRKPDDRRNPRTYQELRKLAVRHQLDIVNRDDYQPGVHRNKKECQRMLSSRVYGDDHEISALAEEVMVRVRVLVLRKDGSQNWLTVGEDRPDYPTIRLALTYISERSSTNHYMSLRPMHHSL